MSGVGLSRPTSQPSPPLAPDRGGERFRPDLEGLRAIAVLLVLLYHAGVPGFGGGYVGVDVFFVLSGFLISGIIVRELEAGGTIRLAAFYARRARRLLPAAALALLATVAASVIFLPPLRIPDIAGDAAAAAVYASNIRFAVQATDYLGADLAPSPLLHYWSLGVEEQFYVFWPAMLLLATRLGGRSIGRLAGLVTVVGVASFGLSVVLTGIAAPWAFYSLPTRAWELALGALLALAAVRGLAVPRTIAALAGSAGIGLIVLAGIVIGVTTPYPGWAALLPTIGAALVIGAGLGSGEQPTPPARALSVGPLRFLGRISYSLYLWHWPMLVVPAAAIGAELPLPVRVGLAAATIPVAAASQRWVEEPIRRGRVVGLAPRRSLALAGVLTLVVAGSSIGVGIATADRLGGTEGPPDDPTLGEVLGTPRPAPAATPTQQSGPPGASGAATSNPVPTPGTTPPPTIAPTTPSNPVPADLQPPLLTAREDLPRVYDDGCHVVQLATESGPCTYGDATSATTVVLFGDSHAAQWFPALQRLATERGWRLVSLTKALCGAVDHPVWNGNLKRAYLECDAWREHALDRIADEQPDLVVVANSKFASFQIDGRQATVPETLARWPDALARTLVTLDGLAGGVVLVADTPQAYVDPPVCLSAHLDDALACATPMAQAIDVGRRDADRAAAATAGVPFVDPAPWVCPSDPCPVIIGNVLVYHDGGHMTRTFSTALAPYLAPSLPLPGR